MSNPNKRKGTSCENECVLVMKPYFPLCERRALRGKNDAGDIAGLPVPCECKHNVADIAAAIKEAKQQADRLEEDGYCAFIHARGKPPEEAYGVVHGWFLGRLLRVWADHKHEYHWEQP